MMRTMCWMCRFKVVLRFVGVLVMVGVAIGQEVLSEEGNIVLVDAEGDRTSLSSSGYDSEPVLSPGGERVAFVRSFRPPEDDSGHGYTNCSVWIVDADGAHPRRLVTGQYDEEVKAFLCDLHGLHFSPDGSKLYFQSAPVAVESAVHVFDLATDRHRFVTMGSLLRVIPKGQYKGNLLVQQHRYFLGGGSYDWVWLISPQGEELGAVSQGEGAYGGGIDSFWHMYVGD